MRDYDPTLGRFVESDPIGIAGGLDTYLYANANPGKLTDPKGLKDFTYGPPVNDPSAQIFERLHKAAELTMEKRCGILPDVWRTMMSPYQPPPPSAYTMPAPTPLY
jgi:hypothetical protein